MEVVIPLFSYMHMHELEEILRIVNKLINFLQIFDKKLCNFLIQMATILEYVT
jgi:hypothetical protein